MPPFLFWNDISVEERIDQELLGKLKALMVVRVLVVTILLGTLAVFNVTPLEPAFNLQTVYTIIFLTYGLTIVYVLILNRVRRLLLFAHIQIIGDIMLETALIYITGGIESPFAFTYIISIMVAGTILYRRGGILSASLCAILYGGMVDLQYFGILPGGGGREFSSRAVVYNIFLNMVAFLLSAVLSSSLAETLRKTRERLELQSFAYASLRSLYENIFHSISTGLLTTDREGRITSFNSAAEEITGCAAHEANGRLWHELFGIERLRQFYLDSPGKEEMSEQFSRLREERMTRKDGSEIIIGVTVSVLKEEGMEPTGIVAGFRDLTELVAQEERFKRQERLAEMGEMSARMAHEIRNPLASMSGSMQILRHDLSLADDNARLMDIAIREADRLNHIITEFLTYARPGPLKQEKVDLRDVVGELAILLKNHRDYRSDINLRLQFDDNNYCISGDAAQLRQVFWNLAINALHAMPGGGDLEITGVSGKPFTRSGETRPYVVISFRDSGTGIAAQDMKSLFLPFFTTKESGTGLGLAVAYRIVEEHGGRIDVTSILGEGSCFTVTFPMAQQ